MLLTVSLLACNSDTAPKAQGSRAKNLPEVAAKLEQFKQQKHRFEFNGCEILYNGQAISFDMTMEDIVKVTGPYNEFDPAGDYKGMYLWDNLNIDMFTKEISETADAKPYRLGIFLNLTNLKGEPVYKDYVFDTIFLYEGYPIDLNTQVRDLMNQSTFEFNDFSVDSDSLTHVYRCDGKTLSYWFGTGGNWIYKGEGHLRFKSHINQNNVNPFSSFSITWVEEERNHNNKKRHERMIKRYPNGLPENMLKPYGDGPLPDYLQAVQDHAAKNKVQKDEH